MIIILKNKSFSNLRDSIGEGVKEWIGEKNPRLKEILDKRNELEEREENSSKMARVRRGKRGTKQPVKFKSWEPTFVSPYDPPKEYNNWKGEAAKYYRGREIEEEE